MPLPELMWEPIKIKNLISLTNTLSHNIKHKAGQQADHGYVPARFPTGSPDMCAPTLPSTYLKFVVFSV
jgi:hypothetical protein